MLKYYFDLMSQPSRALKLFLIVNKIPHESCPVALRSGEHKLEPYLNVNRFGRVPAIDDDGFKLSESIAIVRYLSRKYNIDNQWYPKDMKAQALVDEYLESHHLDLRLGCSVYFFKKVLIPMMTGKPPTNLERPTQNLEDSLNKVEDMWLGKGNSFLTGNHISVADIFAACEIEQPRMAGYDPTVGRPKLAAWLNRVRKELEPNYAEVHKILNKIAAKQGQAKL